MATNTTIDEVFISRTDSGFPAYLDFTTLRTNAVNYLGPITSGYWTDYNLHDPGITTLEVLLYALMDLGYRVNFPIVDLLTPSPSGRATLDFFTPAQVLGGNPFTVVDYRKKLMDLAEVRNAWLDATAGSGGAVATGGAASSGGAAVRGVYSVFLELELDAGDFGSAIEWTAYRDGVVREVKAVLQAHRNLCEDFAEPVVLSRKPISVNADIELADGVSPADVYRRLVTALYTFFSPAPPYYTLGQLVELGVPLDQVFTGRPFEKWPSHGFILDGDLPERPTGRTPIYLSAVYRQFLEVAGVKTVRKLTVDTGAGSGAATAGAGSGAASGSVDSGGSAGSGVVGTAVAAGAGSGGSGTAVVWTAVLAEDALPVLDISGSRFRWFRGGQLLAVDLGSETQSLQQQVIHGGKVLYPAGDLDVAIPKGRWLEGLSQYSSIQNDYPLVYGIGPGGLPGTASAERQAQGLQLKGYLLLFDQLLADYLAQLGNIQTLFSMGGATPDGGAPKDGGGPVVGGPVGGGPVGGATYFAGDVSSVPGLGPLLRFPPTGDAGTMLAYPVDAGEWEAIAGKGTISCAQLGTLSPFTFTDAADRDVALAQLVLYFGAEKSTVSYILVEKQVAYVITGVGNDFVLLSRGLFPDVAAASKEAAMVLYIGGTKQNYHLQVLTANDCEVEYSFSLVETGASYVNYVQALLESPRQYTQRRTAFLQHLISRFAESFTDYALLSAGFLPQQEIADRQVGLMEKFLGDFPQLSGDRGQAFNYTKRSWDTTNSSGLEKRFIAFSGIMDGRQQELCSFEVGEEDKQCQVALTLNGNDWMVCPDPIPAKSATPAAADLLRNMSNAENYQLLHRPATGRWAIGVLFYGGYQAVSVADWPDEVQAAGEAGRLAKMRQMEPEEEDIAVNQFEYRAELLDAGGTVIRVSMAPFNDERSAWEDAGKRVHRTNDDKSWQFDAAKQGDIGRLIRNSEESTIGEYLDVRELLIAIKHDIPHKPDHCRFTIADEEKTVVFASTDQFPTDTQGRAAANTRLFQLTMDRNYVVYFDEETDRYRLSLQVEGKSLLVSEEEFAEEASARAKIGEIVGVLRQRLYHLRMVSVPLNWKFSFYMGVPNSAFFVFHSDAVYATVEEARAAAQDFYTAANGWEVRKTDKSFAVAKVGGKDVVVLDEGTAVAVSAAATPVNEADLQQSVQWKNSMRAMQAGDEALLSALVRPDAASKTEGFVYRLTDKNRPRAFHPLLWTTADEAKVVRETLIAKGRKGYRYPEISLGGDNVYFKGTETGGDWHFVLKCRNDYFARIGLVPANREWTLFESLAGYPSADAAQQAFGDQYLTILEMAMDRVNYGDKDYIAWTDEGRRKAVVVVPQDLQDAMNKAGLNVADELVKAAKAYPIRKKERFIFLLVNEVTGETDWASAGTYDNAQQAHVAFDHFRLLLNVGGNYYVDYDDENCGFRLGLREVLAESIARFPTVAAAWGAVEEFIFVAQSAGGFHPEKRKDGTWGYFIAGTSVHAQHPCQYASETERDAALQNLFTAAQGFSASGLFSGTTPVQGTVDETLLGIVLDMADAVWAGQFFQDESGLYLLAAGGSVKIRPADKDIMRDKWEEQLLQYIAYFPVTRKNGIYRLEMKLPGACFAAWTGASSYSHAMDAWNAFLALLPLLDDLSNYKSVHYEPEECGEPGRYGIELYKPEEILAYGPQTYAYAEMASRGIGRARDCINMEGLHLVEHLLLRPEKGVKTAIPVCPPAAPFTGFMSQPGADPYSFIITAFLPAWPERFRKPENRQVLERRLQAETPAHILLRILWLTPMDMCGWETQYKDWLNSLRPGKPCVEFSGDEWMKLLFSEPIHCMAEPVAEAGKNKDSDEWLSEINLAYCWKDRECADTSKWSFDVVKPGSASGGIQFKGTPTPSGQAVSGMAKMVRADNTGTGGATAGTSAVGTSAAGGAAAEAGPMAMGNPLATVTTAVKKVEQDVANKAEDVVDKVKDVADKAEDVVNKVQNATDKVHDVSNKLHDVENIAKDILPLVVEEIPVVGPALVAVEKIAVRVGLWTKILHKGVDMLEGLLKRLKDVIEKAKKE